VDVTVAVGTFGDQWWQRLALSRAVPSARGLGVPVVHAHAATLHEARNAALAQVETEWVVHLDADDELEAGYVAAMREATADVRVPAVRYVHRGGSATHPTLPKVAGHRHNCTGACLTQGNWLVVGAAARTELVRRVGGWRDFEWSEDWDLWLRCHLAGATIQAVPRAVYRAHVNPRSRNRALSPTRRLAAHRAIAAANGIP
jgi:hypothetical protein